METKSSINLGEEQWYYVQGGRRMGPVSRNSLQYLFQHQSMPTDTLVWNPDLPDWQPAHQTNLSSEITSGRPANPTPGNRIPKYAVIPEPFGEARFYYIENSREKGPVSHKTLYALLTDNKVPPNTRVRRSGSTEWKPAQDIFPVTDRIIPEPPKLPHFWAAKTKEVPEFKKTSVLLVIFLSFITLGIYYPIWFLTRREALNSLQGPAKLNKAVFIVAVIVSVLTVILDIGTEFTYEFGESFLESGLLELSKLIQLFDLLTHIEHANNLLTLSVGLAMLFQAFRVKRILQDHYNDHLGQNISFSGLATFFFQIWYLQYKINRLV